MGLERVPEPSSAKNWTLINAGGTSLSSTTSLTSGLTGYDSLQVFVFNATQGNNSTYMYFYLNNDTTSKYSQIGLLISPNSPTYNPNSIATVQNSGLNGASNYTLGWQYSGVLSGGVGYSGGVSITGCTGSGPKMIHETFGVDSQGSNNPIVRSYVTQGMYTGSSPISSIYFGNTSGSFNGGTFYVYGSTI